MPTPPRLVTAFGKTQPIARWAAELGVPANTIRTRIDRFGWDPARAVTTRPDRRFRRGGRHRTDAPRPCPKLRRKGDQAFCRWKAGGRSHYLAFGAWGSADAQAAYRRFAAEWAAGGELAAAPPGRAGAVVSEVVAAWRGWADGEYRKLGERTSEYHLCRAAAAAAHDLYGPTPAAEFTPDRLRAVRDAWVREGKARKTVNGYAARVVRMFGWAAGRSLVPPTVPAALREVERLKPGRTAAAEPKARGAVPDGDVAATLAALPDTPRGKVISVMVGVPRVLGCRPRHLAEMRLGDLDRAADPWVYTPPAAANKTFHRGKAVRFFLGPRARGLLAPLLAGLGGGDHVFAYPRAGGRCRVAVDGYAEAVRSAAKAAGAPHWSPHHLRHALATEVAERTGSVEAAAAAIGDGVDVARRVYVHHDPAERTRLELALRYG